MDAVPRLAGEYAIGPAHSYVFTSFCGTRGGRPCWAEGGCETYGRRFECRDEEVVLLLFGTGVGVDARAGGGAGRVGSGCARDDSRGGAGIDVDDGGVLPAARPACFGGRVEIHRGKPGAGARNEERG